MTLDNDTESGNSYHLVGRTVTTERNSMMMMMMGEREGEERGGEEGEG